MNLTGLQRGNRGSKVEELQKTLNTVDPNYTPPLVIDGRFGKFTFDALVAFQTNNNLVPSGVVDHLTNETLEVMMEKKEYGVYYQETTRVNLTEKSTPILYMQAQLKFLYPAYSFMEVNGILDGFTQVLLWTFQRENNIPVHGNFDSLTNRTLHNAVKNKNSGKGLFAHSWELTSIPQSQASSCWAACTAMMNDTTEEAVLKQMEQGYLKEYGSATEGLLTGLYYNQPYLERIGSMFFEGRLHVKPGELESMFAANNKLIYYHYHPPKRWKISELKYLIVRSPIMFAISYENKHDYNASQQQVWKGKSTAGHYRIITTMITDENESGNGTYFAIEDPLPVNEGSFYYRTYHEIFNDSQPVRGIFTRDRTASGKSIAILSR